MLLSYVLELLGFIQRFANAAARANLFAPGGMMQCNVLSHKMSAGQR